MVAGRVGQQKRGFARPLTDAPSLLFYSTNVRGGGGNQNQALLMAYNKLDERDLRTKASTALNRRAASKGMVILRNKGKLLPLDVAHYKGAKGSVLVAGPVANNGNNTYVL